MALHQGVRSLRSFLPNFNLISSTSLQLGAKNARPIVSMVIAGSTNAVSNNLQLKTQECGVRHYWQEIVRVSLDPRKPGKQKYEDPGLAAVRSARAQSAEGGFLISSISIGRVKTSSYWSILPSIRTSYNF